MGKIKVEAIVVVEITLDGIQVNKDVVKLLQEDETGGHALSAMNKKDGL